ncbi:hypothetical protein J6590_098009 [Homalodisca vitripennis]|nr:hypothetical protein J6590_098009 [Homalodisca vitripennis]
MKVTLVVIIKVRGLQSKTLEEFARRTARKFFETAATSEYPQIATIAGEYTKSVDLGYRNCTAREIVAAEWFSGYKSHINGTPVPFEGSLC